MKKLVESGIHNPKTGKPVSLDWARRNLGTTTISVANVSSFEEAFDHKVTDGSKDISEFEMSISAAEMAIAEAGIEACDIDCIMHVSGSIRMPSNDRSADLGLNHCMRGYQVAFPDLRPDCLLQHQDSGCSGIVPPFRMAKSMLASGDFKNILVVTSNVFPRDEWRENVQSNDMSLWINYVLFGDAATAFVLRGSSKPSEVACQTKSKLCYELLDVNSITDTSFFIFQSFIRANQKNKSLMLSGRLNPDAAKQVFSTKMLEWMKSQGIQISKLDALLLHQPNSYIMKKIRQLYAGEKLMDIAGRYGNLVSCSVGVQFYEQISQGRIEMKNGSTLAGFTLGAHAGNTYGGFIARAWA